MVLITQRESSRNVSEGPTEAELRVPELLRVSQAAPPEALVVRAAKASIKTTKKRKTPRAGYTRVFIMMGLLRDKKRGWDQEGEKGSGGLCQVANSGHPS